MRRIPFIASQFFLAYLPFHVFLSQSLSLLTGGLEFWKIAKDVLLLLVVVFTICLVLVQGTATRIFWFLLGFTLIYGVLHLVVWALHLDIHDRSAALGIVYNMRLSLFLLLGYSAVLLMPQFAFSSIIKLILGVSTVVATFGVLQFFLPQDILTHFGYGIERGARPTFLIDDKSGLLRVTSTLREPNALGAYLIVPIALLTSLWLRYWNTAKRYIIGGMLGLHLLALFLTFSRSSWLAAALAVFLVVIWQYKDFLQKVIRRFWPLLVGVVVVAVIGLLSLRHTHFFQQYIIHSDPNEQVQDLDSNDYHLLFIKQGLEGIADHPFGHGPGTAGLASIQNPAGSFLTENYFVQIGYEIGIIGLAVFIALNTWIYCMLWVRRGVWTPAILAAFWGYVLTNMLLHTWSNEAVAAQWWLLAGMLLGASSIAPKAKKKI